VTAYGDRLEAYRHRRDHFFGGHPHSPLTEEQQASFQGLDYFPPREDLVLNVALDTSGEDAGQVIDVQTTDGNTKQFERIGDIEFTVDEQSATLRVYRDVLRGGLFIPFRDATTGEETYEVGRYLEPQERPDGTLDVDFNYAYNPFCAYGSGWSCPIPPEENHLTVPIRAGERAFQSETEER
jgi:hypothetical protein